MENWDEFFIGIAGYIATRSKDPDTQVGTLLVREKRILTTGYNGIPRNMKDDIPDRLVRPRKYIFFEHAERNAIYNAAYVGVSTKGATAYLTLPPCEECARAMIQSGVTRVVWKDQEIPERRLESQALACHFLREAGVVVDVI